MAWRVSGEDCTKCCVGDATSLFLGKPGGYYYYYYYYYCYRHHHYHRHTFTHESLFVLLRVCTFYVQKQYAFYGIKIGM